MNRPGHGNHPDIKKFLASLPERYTVTKNRKNHWLIYDGETHVYTMSGTPRNVWRTLKNARGHINRYEMQKEQKVA